MRTHLPARRCTAAIAFAAIACGGVRAAHAADCSTLPNPIYGIGGSATKPLFAKVGAALAASTPTTTLVYQAPGACNGINAVLAATPLSGTASYWDTAGKEQTCTLPTVSGPVADFASMGNSATSCPGVTALPADVGDFLGPVNAYDLIVPKASPELSISAEAAYFAFGYGDQSGVAPWNVLNQLFVRDALSAAQIFIAKAIGISPSSFKGVDTKSNSGTLTAVASSTSPSNALGLVSGEVADQGRAADTIRILAYQHRGQSCGHYPDSTSSSYDKRGVRSGQYWIWAPLHFYAKVDATTKKPVNPAVASFIGYFTEEIAPPATVDLFSIEVKASTVPRCAMEVWRTGDLGDLQSYAPAAPCGCKFDAVATGSTTCKACANDGECLSGAPHCRYGYCEVN
jgi:ABC-type phosphate transport system substrate-binding protein